MMGIVIYCDPLSLSQDVQDVEPKGQLRFLEKRPTRTQAYHLTTKILGIGWNTVQESVTMAQHVEPAKGGRVKGQYYAQEDDPFFVGESCVRE